MKRIIYILFAAFLLVSCEKVIDLDLNEANPNLVIEAKMNLTEGQFVADISRTVSYFGSSSGTPVDNAVVEVSVEGGAPVTVASAGNGLYTAPLTATAGAQLKMTVRDGAETYESELTVVNPVMIDSLPIEFRPGTIFSDEGYFVTIAFKDIAGERNYYRFRFSVNDTLRSAAGDISVLDDEIFDGQDVEFPLSFTETFQPGDRLLVEMWSIDATVFDYYDTITDILISQGGGSTAAPANPNNNWSNDALGLFNPYFVDTMSIVIPQ